MSLQIFGSVRSAFCCVAVYVFLLQVIMASFQLLSCPLVFSCLLMLRIPHYLSVGCQSNSTVAKPVPVSLWLFLTISSATWIITPVRTFPRPLCWYLYQFMASSTVPGSSLCTTKDSGMLADSVSDLILLLVFLGSSWLHLYYFKFSKNLMPRLDLLGKTVTEAEEAGAAIRPRCRSSSHGGKGRKKA